jgi:SAM-dependent methyltransferase
MGMTTEIVRFLAQAGREGVSFTRVLTLGRQHVGVSPERLRRVLAAHGCWPPKCGEAAFASLMSSPLTRFEGFAKALGAASVCACDASAYEGADLLHDLNEPVPAQWHEQFDVVIDSGALEHVFNFPIAIANCLRLVKLNGRVFFFTPANNHCGHGFYQFSPELFYRVLSPANGFAVERLWARTHSEASSNWFGVRYPFLVNGPAYAAPDPAQVGRRVTLVGGKPVLLFIQAKRTARVEILQQAPQQSDYVAQWARAAAGPPASQATWDSPVLAWLRGRFSERVCREVLPALAWFVDPFRWRRYVRRHHALKNKRLFRRVAE